ncbi:MAG: hypothetical protein COV57_01785 [Candidatus Liptonbacteria bacterium CG11_big_fil_rev_8_21_14_0_20_35_14]|uniref:Uncharacterized protein n=1 Tax=Candidatus Liptonbacteria bacterium CG11_big_fil_rev_8_21_14_0_20_35_14 TaxID=1974634 RepID=A0A2H0N7T4_9BACT|nr:MAG: hypothetical protein COV57_01785 [Candidatus Liptonbacteria bacterium CG11_big_fil_rev_8_21_14_0_20_35_14]
MVNKNVYICSMPRSGSTLLGLILNNNSNVEHLGESPYWHKLNPSNVICSCGNYNCEFLNDVYKKAIKSSNILALLEACQIIELIEEPNKIPHPLSLKSNNIKKLDNLNEKILLSCKGLNELSDLFRYKTGKEVTVDNTKYINFAEVLIDMDWLILLLFRDPRGILNSMKNSGIRKSVPRNIEFKIPILERFSNRAIKLIKRKNVLPIRYEDLCQNSFDTIKLICSFIGVNFEDNMLKFNSNKGHILFGNRMIRNNEDHIKEDNSWKYELSKEEKKMIEISNLYNLYQQFGYIF